jgi:hypothetical protein
MQAAATQAAPEDVRAFIQEYFDAWKGPRLSPNVGLVHPAA